MGGYEEHEQTLDAFTTEYLVREIIERKTNIGGNKPRVNKWAIVFILLLVTYAFIYLIPYFIIAGFFNKCPLVDAHFQINFFLV